MVRELVLWKSGVPIFRPSGGKGREQILARAMSSSWTKNESSYTNSLKGVSCHVLDKLIEPVQGFLILSMPVYVVIPCIQIPFYASYMHEITPLSVHVHLNEVFQIYNPPISPPGSVYCSQNKMDPLPLKPRKVSSAPCQPS